MKVRAILTNNETDAIVSILNSIIEKYCEKYPEEYNFDDQSVGYVEGGEILCANGDDLIDTLMWVNSEVIPDLLNN